MSTLKTESQLLQIRVDVIPIDQISDFRNKLRNISRSLSILDVGTVSQTVRSGNGPYIGKHHARPALLTVFSTTQLGHSITLLGIHAITDFKKLQTRKVLFSSWVRKCT